MKTLAVLYDRRGSSHREAGNNQRAITAFQKAIEHAPEWTVPWYNLGLTFKYMGDWPESFRCNAEAVRLDPSNEAAVWNLGIAATAIGHWAEARRAWLLYGLDLPPGEGPPNMNLGVVPIRINPDSDGEVVWARRIDPARAVVTSIPLPESGHRHGDLLLNDGAPVGYRKHRGKDVPVLNSLARLHASPHGTFEVSVEATNIDDLVDFEKCCEAAGCFTEDWSTMRVPCRACSEGNPHEHPEPPVSGQHRFAVASSSLAYVQEAVGSWLRQAPSRSASPILEHLSPMPFLGSPSEHDT